jgi:hypothetical protein
MSFGLRHLIYGIGLPFWYLQTCKCILCMFVLVLMRVIFGLLVCVVVINLYELYDLARLYWPWNLVWKLNGLSIRFYILVDLGIWYCTFIDIVLFSDFIRIFGLPAHKDFYFGFPLFFLWMYIMKVKPATHHAHYIIYLFVFIFIIFNIKHWSKRVHRSSSI